MSVSLQKSWPGKRDYKDLLWASGAISQEGKRKRQGGDKQDVRPLNKRMKSILLDEEDRKPPI